MVTEAAGIRQYVQLLGRGLVGVAGLREGVLLVSDMVRVAPEKVVSWHAEGVSGGLQGSYEAKTGLGELSKGDGSG